MDYGFSTAEALYLYGLLKKEVRKCEQLKKAGQVSLVKGDLQILSAIIGKLDVQHPGFGGLVK